MRFWLVQRMNRAAGHRGPITKANHLCADYMGASEFERGALPRSFTAMKRSSLGIFPVQVSAFGAVTPYHVIAAKEAEEKLQAEFQQWANASFVSQEPAFIAEATTRLNWNGERFSTEEYDARYPLAWWALTENYFWSLNPLISAMWFQHIETSLKLADE